MIGEEVEMENGFGFGRERGRWTLYRAEIWTGEDDSCQRERGRVTPSEYDWLDLPAYGQTPLNRFVVYMLYSKLCNKYSDKSNTRNLGLSLSEATSAVGAINSCPPSATLCIAAHRVALIIFF